MYRGICPILLGLGASFSHALELELPIAIEDVGYLAYGVAPYGYHVAEHRHDGHPGLDLEFIPGRKVRAAHGGSLRYTTDVRDPTLKTVTIEFKNNGINYQTFYTNIASLEPDIDNNATVVTGQTFGTPAAVVRSLGSAGSITYAMTHFQLADNRVSYGLSNASAISPEPYFSAIARQTLAAIWQKSQYSQMICEPYLSSARGDLPYPTISRRWLRDSGNHGPVIEFICDYNDNNPNTAYQYRLLGEDGAILETGNAVVSPVPAGISLVDLQPTNTSKRLGVMFVKDGSMQLDYSSPGGIRPANLSNASNYSSSGAVSCANPSDGICFSGNQSPYRTGELLDIGVALDWNKLVTNTTVDLWVALVLPTGTMFFAQADGSWQGNPLPFVQNLSATVRARPILTTIIPGNLSSGNYTMYAVLNQSGKAIDDSSAPLASNIARALIYIAP